MSTVKEIPYGLRFGLLVVLRRVNPGTPDARHHAWWLCRCDCGREVLAQGVKLRRGQRRSCGSAFCRGRDGRSRTLAYSSWASMRERCLNPESEKWVRYGGRGIRICDRWQVYANFLLDMGDRPAGTTLGREDNDGDYEPGNCRWETTIQQSRNRGDTVWIEVDGGRRKLIDVCEERGLSAPVVRGRLKLGWSVDDALTVAVRSRGRK